MESSFEDNVRIHHECDSGIETSAPWLTVLHHETTWVMNDDPQGLIFLSHPLTNNEFLFCPTPAFIEVREYT